MDRAGYTTRRAIFVGILAIVLAWGWWSALAAPPWVTFGGAWGRTSDGPYLSVDSEREANEVRFVISNPAGRWVDHSWSIWCEKGYDNWYRSGSGKRNARTITRYWNVPDGWRCDLNVSAYTGRASSLAIRLQKR